MHILFRPEAHTEALEAQAWYESRAQGLGLEFARALEAAVTQAARKPETFPSIGLDGCRRILLRKFPFLLIYQVRGSELLVVAVFHHRRDPSVLVQRTGG